MRTAFSKLQIRSCRMSIKLPIMEMYFALSELEFKVFILAIVFQSELLLLEIDF